MLGFTVNGILLFSTIQKLRTAKVSSADTGHLKIRDAIILLVLVIAINISAVMSSFVLNH